MEQTDEVQLKPRRQSRSRGAAQEGGQGLLSWHQGILETCCPPTHGCRGPRGPPESRQQHSREAHCKVSPLQPLGSSGPLPVRSLSSERPPRVSAAPKRPGAGTLRLDKAESPPSWSIRSYMPVSTHACEPAQVRVYERIRVCERGFVCSCAVHVCVGVRDCVRG